MRRTSQEAEKSRNQPISRILSAFAVSGSGGTTIPLGPQLLAGSSDLPGGSDGPSFPPSPLTRLRRSAALRHARATLFGLAPCGVLPATGVTAGAVRSYRTFSPLLPPPESRGSAVCFLCHYPSGIASCPGVTRRTALRSSDFPPRLRLRLRQGKPYQDRVESAAVVWLIATNDYPIDRLTNLRIDELEINGGHSRNQVVNSNIQRFVNFSRQPPA